MASPRVKYLPLHTTGARLPITEILKAAKERAERMGLPYEGALLPREAYEIIQSAPA